MKAWAAAAVAVLLAACAPAERRPEPTPVAAFVALDCARGFEPLSAAIAAQPELVQAPSPGEPYRFLNHRSGSPSYVVTLPDAPAHPAILMQEATAEGMWTTGCSWGDGDAYQDLVAYIEGLARRRGGG